jgi:NAD(P)-dependent dehydrogenase (short-subunit alcohol dehydrogenase family)
MMLASPELQDPGFVASLPIKRLGTPEEIAATVQFLASPGGAFFVGQVLSPNGGAVI